MVVIGAGFGGLGAALSLAAEGRSVMICEALRYPGGCASTFERQGARYDAGATLLAGLAEGQLFERWNRRFDLGLQPHFADTVIELRTGRWSLPIGGRREHVLQALSEHPGAPVSALRRFFGLQARVADQLWPLLADPDLLLPLDAASLGHHLRQVGGYARLAPLLGRPLGHVLSRFGLQDFEPLRTWLDASCQITVQTSVDKAEALFALSALDYPFRGAAHLDGGVGELAWALLRACDRLGGRVRLASRVKSLKRDRGDWLLNVRGRSVRARTVIANLLPQDLQRLLGVQLPSLVGPSTRVASGWGAVMQYMLVRDVPELRPEAHHLQLVMDPDAPLVEGNHMFCSLSASGEPGRAPDGLRVATASTHIAASTGGGLHSSERIEAVQLQMTRTLSALAPQLSQAVQSTMPASPRTFQRFTGRKGGLVGGVPRVAGLHNYRGLWPRPASPGLWLVGDSVFPGQSALACALGGVRVARAATLFRPTRGLLTEA